MKAYFRKQIFDFRNPAGTSRGILLQKPSWFIFLENEVSPEFKAIGECSIIPGLSIDNEILIESKLQTICNSVQFDEHIPIEQLSDFPAIRFAIETAVLDYKAKGTKLLFPSEFTNGIEGIPINGLIWMGSEEFVLRQIEEKIKLGFKCLKLKVGQEDFKQGFPIIKQIRTKFSKNDLEIRTDANGAFSFEQAKLALKLLADMQVHSIEQPIAVKQWDSLAQLCEMELLPIALDEELIGVTNKEERIKLLEVINPQFIILKPSLLGGFAESDEWIDLAKTLGIGWWATSALESNIGLNAIAQWTFTKKIKIPQGLGTGSLYKRNIESPLTVNGEKLFYIPNVKWNYEFVS